MSEIVKTDARNFSSCDSLVEGFRERVWVDWLSIPLAEDEVVALIRCLESESLFNLRFSVAFEHHQSSFIECNDAASAPGLGRCELELISDEGDIHDLQRCGSAQPNALSNS